FILAPLYAQSDISPLARFVSLAYPVGDLFVLFGVTMALLRPSRYKADRLVLGVLVLAVASLIVADSWVAWLLLYADHVYKTGNAPDLFWSAFYLFVPLASLMQVRLARHEPRLSSDQTAKNLTRHGFKWSDFTASLRFFLPFAAALLASMVILIHATVAVAQVGWRSLIAPYAVCLGLLLLVILRQEVTFLQNVQL